jgi:hypothetical protein
VGAKTLYLSHNTIHGHTRSIYRKLGVSSRQDALESARERSHLGLVERACERQPHVSRRDFLIRLTQLCEFRLRVTRGEPVAERVNDSQADDEQGDA